MSRLTAFVADTAKALIGHPPGQAQLGELMPAEKGGRGNKALDAVKGFSSHALAKFRKVAAARDASSSNTQTRNGTKPDSREVLEAELAAAVEAIRNDAKERQRKGGEEKVRQTFAEALPDDRKTSAARAKMAGTNRQYIQDADTLAAIGGLHRSPGADTDTGIVRDEDAVELMRAYPEAVSETGTRF